MSLLDCIRVLMGWNTKRVSASVSIPIGKDAILPANPPPGLAESRDLVHLHPLLRERYLALKADFQAETGHQMFETCTYRSITVQKELYQVGRRDRPGERVLTNCDGETIKSRHNLYPSRAVDVAIDVDPGPGKLVSWEAREYTPIGPLAQRHDLIWGGAWKLKDLPHIELPKEAA